MNKKADVHITYMDEMKQNFLFFPEDVGISNSCKKIEFFAAVNGYLNRVFEEKEPIHGVPQEISIEMIE